MIRTRSPIVQLGIRAASPLALVVAVYLFFAGHNQPGGGFSAGLVIGAVVALRTIAGMPRPSGANTFFAVGMVLIGIVAIAPVFAGEPILDQVIVERELPVLGKVKTGTAAVFDVGVTAIVVGLFIAVFDGLTVAPAGEETA